MLFDPLEEIPTLLHQRIEEHQTNQFETNDHVVSQLSINDKLKQENQMVSVRRQGQGDLGSFSVSDFVNLFNVELEKENA